MIERSENINKDHIESKQLLNKIDAFDNNALKEGESVNRKGEENIDLIPYLTLANKGFKTFSQRLLLKDIFEPNSYRSLINIIKLDNYIVSSLYSLRGFNSIAHRRLSLFPICKS